MKTDWSYAIRTDLFFFLLLFSFFFVNNLQYGFICKYCATDENTGEKERKKEKHMMNPRKQWYCKNTEQG